ncbi:MAG: leucine-rich repeat domain-containing protein, partial [Oscillospiraceae bacterium]|nr:leucine-rich repeat domain-containing protein [Oscillospiraceae bacterium]
MNFSSKKNIIIIIIAALLALGVGGTAIALGISNMPANRVSRYMGAAERYLSEQNYEQAVIEFQRILEIEPMNVDAYLGLADAYLGLGDTEKAIEILREGLEKTSDDRIKSMLDELTKNPEMSSAISSAFSSEPAVSEPVESVYGSMGSVTIFGQEFDIATTTELCVINIVEYNNQNIFRIDILENHVQIETAVTKEDLENISKLQSLRSLCIFFGSITNITPLAKLTNLTSLALCNNQISNISQLVNLTNLTSLHLDFNQISDITPLAKLTNLTDLGLSGNKISDITPLAGLMNLTYLQLS